MLVRVDPAAGEAGEPQLSHVGPLASPPPVLGSLGMKAPLKAQHIRVLTKYWLRKMTEAGFGKLKYCVEVFSFSRLNIF